METEMITANLSWLGDLCAKLHEFNLSLADPLCFGTNVRIVPKTDYAAVFSILRNAGFEYINIGIESGSERVRKDILRRNYSNEDVISIFKEAKNHGIKPHAYNMIGLPGETPEDFRKTIELNRLCQPEDPHLCIFFPYPKTDLFRLSVEKGLMRKNIDLLEEREEAALDMDYFSPKTIEKYYSRFEWDVYRGTRNIFALLKGYVYRRFMTKSVVLLRIVAFLRRLKSGTRTVV